VISGKVSLATSVSLVLAAGVLGVVAPPAQAVRAVYEQTTDIHLGGLNNDYSNAGTIDIFDQTKATPYPAEITVPDNALIVDLEVQIFGLTHSNPDDIDILLVAPGGQQATLMSDAGGNVGISNVSLKFDADATTSFPDSTIVTSGTYSPSNWEFPDTYPAPAPAPHGGTSFGEFLGTNAAGTWRLFIVDDSPGFGGGIQGGWRLTLDLLPSSYPSPIMVTGLGSITDVNVTLHDVTSTFPDDMDVLLVAPGGQQSTLISDAGGTTDVAGVDITLDDEAAALLSDSDPLATAAYKPANYPLAADPYPAPAPASTGGFALSVFDGGSPNGVWALYAVDDSPMDTTSIGGWSLDITWADVTSPTGSVSVNAGSKRTKTRSVVLDLNAADATPGSGVAQMRFSNDGKAFTAYQPHAAAASWTMLPGDGTKRVYAQFKDADGNESSLVTDTIVLDTKGPRAKKLSPAKGAERVGPGVKIKVKASEKLDKTTVRRKGVFLKKQGVPGRVEAKVKYVARSATIVVTPRDPLGPRSTYLVTVRSLKDLVGNRWDQKPRKKGAQALRYRFETA